MSSRCYRTHKFIMRVKVLLLPVRDGNRTSKKIVEKGRLPSLQYTMHKKLEKQIEHTYVPKWVMSWTCVLR